MPRFFLDDVSNETLAVGGADATHIAKALRMQKGETLTVCDGRGLDAVCEIVEAGASTVRLRVLSREPSSGEPGVRVTLFQALPKADKMELIVQKAVELGASAVVPVLTARCVSRPDSRQFARKIERWNGIAREAAGQSGRGCIPVVEAAMDFGTALSRLAAMEHALFFYERLGASRRLREALRPAVKELGLLVGPEGGFEESEADAAVRAGLSMASLGPRILRTETAPLCALSALMFYYNEI